ncbi:MAG: MFS transporter [Candidatus Komeilibacteria bacterium]
MIRAVHNLISFLPKRMKPEIKELFTATLILNFGLALIFIFEPIYLFRLGYSLQQIMLFWVMVYFFYVLCIPLGAKVAEKFGYEHTMFYGTFFWILLYLGLYLIEAHSIFFYITPLFYAAQKSLYWPAYHANFSKYSADSEEGREIGTLNILTSLTFIIGPVVGGFILHEWGFHVLFIVVASIFLLSNVPMLLTKERFVSDPVDYEYSYKRLFHKNNRKKFFAYLGFGEEILVVVVWPIFISLFVKDMLSIGGLVAVTTFLTMLVTFVIGRLSDKMDKRKILRGGAMFYSLSWFLRMIIQGQWGVFLVDGLSRISKNTVVVPLTAITYENAKNHTVMHQVLVFELSLAIGKLITCILVFGLLSIFTGGLLPFYIVFITAGIATWLYTLL